MSYGSWGKPMPRSPGGFQEKLFRRDLLPPWDDRWHRLSFPARAAFLESFTSTPRSTVPVVDATVAQRPLNKLTPEALEELKDAGMVEEVTFKGKTSARLVRGEEQVACPDCAATDVSSLIASGHRRATSCTTSTPTSRRFSRAASP